MRRWIPALAAAGALAGGAMLLRSEYERDQLVTEYFEIRSPKIKGEGKRFTFLTDLHDKEFGRDNVRLLNAIRNAAPDMILVGGDTMVAKGTGDLTVTKKLLRALAAEYPVVCGNGNHELRLRDEREVYGDKYREFLDLLEELGIVHLADSNMDAGDHIRIHGLNLRPEHYRPGYPRMRDAFVTRVLGSADPEEFHLLLAHSPMFFRHYAAWGADLTLAGHFHGGTIRLPLLGGVMTPQYQFFFPWCAGLFDEAHGRKMLVGRGLGTHSVNIRFNDKPQLVVVDVRPCAEKPLAF